MARCLICQKLLSPQLIPGYIKGTCSPCTKKLKEKLIERKKAR